MQGDPEVLKLLNEQLTSELTAINQYFLHSKMQDNWGFTELAEHTRKESFEEMVHAEKITDRILLLDGLPNYQRLFSLRVGQTVREQFEADLAKFGQAKHALGCANGTDALALPLMATASFMHFFWDSPIGGGFVKIAVTLVVFLIPVWWLLRFERQWVTERIAAGRSDGTLAAVPDDVLDSLPTRKARRALRKQARRSGGRRAKKAMRQAQNDALELVQSSG